MLQPRHPVGQQSGSVVITSDGLVVQDFISAQNVMIDLAAYQPLDSDQVFQRVEIVNCKGSKLLIVNTMGNLTFNVVDCRDTIFTFEQPPECKTLSLSTSGARGCKIATSGILPSTSITRSSNLAIIALRSSMKHPIKTINASGIELHAIDASPGTLSAEDLLNLVNSGASYEVILVPDGIGQVQQSEVGWHRYQHQVPSSGIGLQLDSRGTDRLFVCDIVPGSAADASGRIFVGDMLAAVDGVDVMGLSVAEVGELTVGPMGTAVELQVFRPHAYMSHMSFNVERVLLIRGNTEPLKSDIFSIDRLQPQPPTQLADPAPHDDAQKKIDELEKLLSQANFENERLLYQLDKKPEQAADRTQEVALPPSVPPRDLPKNKTRLVTLERGFSDGTPKKEGALGGVGIKFYSSDKTNMCPKVIEVNPGGPAGKSGQLQKDDQIVTINGQDVASLTAEEITGLLMGAVGTSVTLEIM